MKKKTPKDWRPRASEVMSLDEIAAVIADLRQRAKRSEASACNLIIFRLATCCGLRASEIAGLELRHVRLTAQRPYLDLPGSICKYGRNREVPLWWDQSTGRDIVEWMNTRKLGHGAGPKDRVCVSTSRRSLYEPLTRNQVRRRFITCVRCLGRDRQDQLTTHSGRHTFCSRALQVRSLAEVRDAAGHSSIQVTNIYAHVLEQLRGFEQPGDMFEPPLIVTRPIVPVAKVGARARR